MQTNNLLQFIIVTVAVMETALSLFERVDKFMKEHNAQLRLERNAQQQFTNHRKRTRNLEHNAQHSSCTLL